MASKPRWSAAAALTAANYWSSAKQRLGESLIEEPYGLEFAYSAEIYDDHGRLRRVCEDMAATWSDSCTGIETTYLYDVGERLTRVCLDREGQTCGQIRRFLFDHRGFLMQERHLEIGVTQSAASFLPVEIVDPDGLVEIEAADAGNDWTFYTHDARGNVLTRRLEGSTDFDLDYFYDGAGRLIRVEENRGGSPRPLKDSFYGHENSGVDMRRGKLVQARRHNWIRKVAPIGALGIDPGAQDRTGGASEWAVATHVIFPKLKQ